MSKAKKVQRATKRPIAKLESLKQLNLNAAGLDIGSSEIYVAVPEDRDERSVRCFPTFTSDLEALADWLAECQVDTVAMESTGVYWIPIFELLEARGFEVYLVNARQLKNVTGRKSDVLDCQWIQQLHTYGLLRRCFRPDDEICALRALVRHRDNLLRYRAGHIMHMQKALHQMNLQLDNVVSDITGTTGLQIIRAIVAGERNGEVLAQFRDPRCKNSAETIAKSLQGNYRLEHLFALQQALELYDVYTDKLKDCDAQIEQLYAACEPSTDDDTPLPPTKGSRRANEPAYDLRSALYRMAGVDLTQVDSIGALTAQTVLTEIGTDMSRWPTDKHFTSWLGLAPHNDISGGKVLRSGTPKVVNRAAQALRQAAQSLSHSKSALGVFYRRMRAKHGAAKANVIAARKLACHIYRMLKTKQPYQDRGPEFYNEQQRQRELKRLQKQARVLGYTLQLIPA